MDNVNTVSSSKSKKNFWVFLIPSLLGLFLFMAPISFQGELTIPVAILAGALKDLLGDLIVPIITFVIGFMSVATILNKVAKPAFVANNAFLTGLFDPSPLWFAVRTIGGIAVLMTYFQFGPKSIWEENTGVLYWKA